MANDSGDHVPLMKRVWRHEFTGGLVLAGICVLAAMVLDGAWRVSFLVAGLNFVVLGSYYAFRSSRDRRGTTGNR